MKLVVLIGIFLTLVANANPPSAMFAKAIMFNDIELNGDRLVNPPKDLTFDVKNNFATRKKDGFNYRLSWGKEKIGGSQVTAVTESNIEKDNSIYSRTTSFYENGLRSLTYCRGSTSDADSIQKNNLSCVTATRLACSRLLAAYNKEAKANGLPAGADSQLKLTQKVQECSSLLKSYANLAGAMTKQNEPMAKQQAKVIEQDQERIKKHIEEATGGKIFSVTSLKTGSSDEANFNMNKDFLSSMDGLHVMNYQIAACQMNKGNFVEGSSASGNNSGSTGEQ